MRWSLSSLWVGWTISSYSFDWLRRKFKFSNFHIFNDSFVDVNIEELNVVLSFSGQANVDEDDDDIHIEEWDGADNDSIDEEEEENSD